MDNKDNTVNFYNLIYMLALVNQHLLLTDSEIDTWWLGNLSLDANDPRAFKVDEIDNVLVEIYKIQTIPHFGLA